MKKRYIEPNTEVIILIGETLMGLTGSERDEDGNSTGHIHSGKPGTEETNNGEINIDAKPFGYSYNIWDD